MNSKQRLRCLMLLLLVWTCAPIAAPLRGSDNLAAGTGTGQSAGDEKVIIPPGKENLPAEEVFHNIEILKGKPASRLPGMDDGAERTSGREMRLRHDERMGKGSSAKVTSAGITAMIRSTNEKWFQRREPNDYFSKTANAAAKPTSGVQEIMAALKTPPR